MLASPQGFSTPKIGVYVHFPWCLQKCPYCDFLSIKVPGAPHSAQDARDSLPQVAYADALATELTARSRVMAGQAPEVDSIFFGGGTPSLFEPRQVGRVIEAVRRVFRIDPDAEVTVECNPSSVSRDHFLALLDAGVNRVSIGVQGLAQERLRFLGRLHDDRTALDALRAARRAGVPRVSADLIFGVFGQSPDAAQREATTVADIPVDHLSAYALTIEPGTRFGALDRAGRLPLLAEELVAQSFEAVSEALRARGFGHYEVSNYARAGCQSRHNKGYWQGRDYLGLGTGAFGTVTLPGGRLRYRNHVSPERYLEAFSAPPTSADVYRDHVAEREELSPATCVSEAILLGLRLAEGLCPQQVEERFGAPFWTAQRRAAAEALSARGRLIVTESRIQIPYEAWLFADGIIRELL